MINNYECIMAIIRVHYGPYGISLTVTRQRRGSELYRQQKLSYTAIFVEKTGRVESTG